MKRYWTNFIIQDDFNRHAYRESSYDCCLSLDSALLAVETMRFNHTVLAAWIDLTDGDEKPITIWHECYVDNVGRVLRATQES